MEEDNNIKNFSATDIERYHNGLMSAQEMHKLEKAAMDDPFLADALDGYSSAGVNVANDLKDLNSRIAERTGSRRIMAMPTRKAYYWMRVAAMVIVVAGAGILTYTLLNKDSHSENVAQVSKEQEKAVLPGTDSSKESNNSLHSDTVQNSLTTTSTQGNYKTDTGLSQKLDQVTAGLATHQGDSIGISASAANTTRDLAASKVAEPDIKVNNAAVASSEKKISAQEESSIAPQKSKAEDKEAEGNVLRDNTGKPVASFKKRAVDLNSSERRNAPGVFANRELSDTINYGRLNVFRGRVTDPSNNGIPFANVAIPEVNVGTYADAKGNFSLVAPDSVLNVNLRAVGFNNAQVQLRNILPSNQVVLQEDKSLEAIVMSNKKPNTNRSRTAEMVLTEPEPDDGWEKYDSYLANNLKVPDAKDDLEKKGGEVELTFEINNNGEPVNIKVTKSLCKECDEEAIRLVKEGPKWKKKKRREKAKVTITF